MLYPMDHPKKERDRAANVTGPSLEVSRGLYFYAINRRIVLVRHEALSDRR